MMDNLHQQPVYDERLGRIRQASWEIVEVIADWETGRKPLPDEFNQCLSTLQALIEKTRRNHPELPRLAHALLDDADDPQ